MKLSKLWKPLPRDPKRAWRTWAKSNPVRLDPGNFRRVSGHKAFTVVVNNRLLAGEAVNATVVPGATTWLDGALTILEAGPYTQQGGYVGFRTAQVLASATKWFVWATPPVTGAEARPQPDFRFVKMLALPAMGLGQAVPGFGAEYFAVHGSWSGPGAEGAWPTDHFIFFRVHHYAGGQLSPGVVLKGKILPIEP